MTNPNNTLPQHVAFIMDGNGRWAQERNLPRALGHTAGVETVRRVVTFARRKGIPYITLYAFSTENWSRPQEEVNALMGIFGEFIVSELSLMLDNGIKLRIIGEREHLPVELQNKLAHAESITSAHTACTLTLAVSYGGRDEIVRAARRVLERLERENLPVAGLDEELFASCLDTAGTPDPDLLIRTAGEMRLSNFLLWQGAYAELYFPKCFWPDFSDEDFESALSEYRRRTRKFGGV